MANPDDTSKPARSRRKQPKLSTATPAAAPPADSATLTQPAPPLTLEEVIQNERTMLLQVSAMLHCLYEVLPYADDDDSPMHADVACAAARLLNDSAVRLDSVNLRPLFDALRQSGGGAPREDEPPVPHEGPYQVKERTPVYLV